MGIQGLLQFIKNSDENVSAIKPSHLSKFRGKKAAIDAYSWLHKGVFSCAQDLFLNKPTNKYVNYCLKNITLLQDHGVTPVLVFDGGRMPFKVVEQKRREDRQNAKKKADDLVAVGRMNDAYMYMVQSINITHGMASELMKAARKIGVESVVAPYEADAQLVYLEKEGLVDFIISEDSDLIAFGAKKIFLKMQASGHGDLFDADYIQSSLQASKRLRGTFEHKKLLYSAVLSGCDYLKNLPGIGVIKAWKFMCMTENTDIRQFLKKVPSYLKLAVTIEDEYVEGFINAVMAFEYQLVFDTRRKRRVPLRALDADVSKADYQNFLRRFKETELDHLQLALGNIDQKNRRYDDYNPHILSYLYYGAPQDIKEEAKSPVIGFNTEGVYKRESRRQSLKRGSKTRNRSSSSETVYPGDEDLASYYKKMSPRVPPAQPVVERERNRVEPPRKRIKCKFLKYKTEDADFEPVQSRFFKSKSIETGNACKVNVKTDEIEEDEDTIIYDAGKKDIPKENIADPDETIIESKDDIKQAFKAVGVEIDSGSSNDATDVDATQLVLTTPATPNKTDAQTAVVKVPDPPESPVITSRINEIKPKLKEIQNVQKFANVKKRMVPKNQPTLLGFFTKL